MPCLRHRCLPDIPAACSFKTLMICSSVNLPLRIVCLLGGEQNPNPKPGAFQGSRAGGIPGRGILIDNAGCCRRRMEPEADAHRTPLTISRHRSKMGANAPKLSL